MELDFAQVLIEHFELIVVIASLLVGYVLKHGSIFKRIPNSDIPIILMLFAAVLNPCVSGWTIANVVYGGFMGLASTGLHQTFKKFVEKLPEEE